MSVNKRVPKVLLASLFATASVVLAACSGGAGGAASGAASGDAAASGGAAPAGGADMSTHTITFIPKQLNNPFSDVTLSGGQSGAKEIGFAEMNEVGPLEASASSQVSFIDAEIQTGTSAIAIAANDPNAVCDSLKKAREGGAKIIAFDSDTNPECRDLFVNQVVSKDIGIAQVEMIAEQIGGEGKIAILSASANATNQNEWIKYMEEELKSNPKYAKIQLVAKVYGDDDDNKSFQEAQGLLQAHPDLKGIISPTTVGIAATARYLSTSEYKGKVALTGLGLPKEMKPYVKDGTVKEFALWDPAELGYVTSYAAQALLSGEITGKPGDKFTAGKLGERTVEEGGIVIVGKPTRFNADNIDKYNF
ncbi:MAG: rhamnose ABC transporter substrate-binding protein [Actinomycetaceae bacterium]|nr:rhamnose ABC transporter substrate-binding protein [Actinomycetaceae bacterium]